MKIYLQTLLFSLLFSTMAFSQNKSFQCIIMGEVKDRPESKELLLAKENADLRISSISIPIKNGKFHYKLEAEYTESYALVFNDEFENGSWRPIIFFAEPDTVFLSLHSKNRYGENNLRGGLLNQELNNFSKKGQTLFNLNALEKKQEQLYEQNKVFSLEAQRLQAAIRNTKDRVIRDSLSNLGKRLSEKGEDLTPEAKNIKKQYQEAIKGWIEWKTEQIISTPSLTTFRELISLLQMANAPYRDPLPIPVSDLIASYEKKYKPKYPNHPYTAQVETYLQALNSIKKGGKFIDFTAPDFNGNDITLSNQIKGKYALINLWASWCGPCRKKGIDIIPIYQTYHDKGFEVIGVARESNEKYGIDAAKKDAYPWLNLLEINDKQNIWRQYGIGNSGGGTFLVNPDGIILAVSPTAEEVEAILREKLH